MKMNEAFPGTYMRAEDLEDQDLTLTIANVAMEEFTDQTTKRPENKPVISWRQKGAKPLVLNKTNWKAISQVFGTDETDDWEDMSITLYSTEVESFGETRLGIRVRLKAPKSIATNGARAATATVSSPREVLRRAPVSEPEDSFPV